jgi:gas vesicle protein
MDSGSKVLLGALAGAAAGALVAGLFATEEGAEARKRVVEGSKDLTNNLKGKLGDLTTNVKDTVADTYNSVKQTATDFVGQGMDKASSVASNLK